MNKQTKQKIKDRTIYGLLLLILLVFLFPIIWMFLTSVKHPIDAFTMPPVWIFRPTWENYKAIFVQGRFYYYFLNSVVITTVSVFLATLVSSIAAYSFARFRFFGSRQILLGLLLFYMVPAIAYAIPLFMIFSRFNLLDTHLGLILVYTALTIPFSTWVLNGYFVTIPKELEESAMLDGCSRIASLFKIVLPLAAPGITATAIIVFIATWNAFIFTAILASTRAKTLPLAVTGFITDKGIMWGQATAAATVIIIPIFIMIVLAQKYIIMGLIRGGVKG